MKLIINKKAKTLLSFNEMINPTINFYLNNQNIQRVKLKHYLQLTTQYPIKNENIFSPKTRYTKHTHSTQKLIFTPI